jgi:predicted glycoside hydrolase/deacetylase ChbG (UPF0249 family)
MPTRVIINADDLGFSEGVTEGILRAHLRGVVTSATIAANMPAAAGAIARLADAPRLGVGVHLNVCQGPPLSREGLRLAGPNGVMDGTGAAVVRACMTRPGLLDALEAECDAQIRWVLDSGVAPTHLDSHRHVHAFPPVFARVAALARRYHVRFVRWYGEALCGRRWPAPPPGQRHASRLLNLFAAANVTLGADLRGTRGTWGVAHTGAVTAALLMRVARAMRSGAWEIMVHPGLAGGLDRRATRLVESRQAELAALCDARVGQEFQRRGIERIHYGQL